MCTREFIHTQRDPRPHAVNHAVGHMRRNDFPAQAVIRHETLKARTQCRREITLQILCQESVLRHIRVEQNLKGGNLAVTQQDGEFRPRQAFFLGNPFF